MLFPMGAKVIKKEEYQAILTANEIKKRISYNPNGGYNNGYMQNNPINNGYAVRFCTSCGNGIVNGQKFCVKCGKQVQLG